MSVSARQDLEYIAQQASALLRKSGPHDLPLLTIASWSMFGRIISLLNSGVELHYDGLSKEDFLIRNRDEIVEIVFRSPLHNDLEMFVVRCWLRGYPYKNEPAPLPDWITSQPKERDNGRA